MHRIISTNRNIAVDIYSSETGTWRTCHPDSDAHFNYGDLDRGVYWNGSINWIKQGYVRYFLYEFNIKYAV